MKILKSKKTYIIISCLIAIIILISVLLKIYVSKNYDVAIKTDRGESFFVFGSTDERYYLLNTSLGVKVKANSFDHDNKFTDEQLKHIEIIKNMDDKFILENDKLDDKYIFFGDDYVFYTHNTSSYDPKWSDEYIDDVLYYFYKYNIKTNEIERLKILEKEPFIYFNLKLESMLHLYPQFENSLEHAVKDMSYLYDIDSSDSYRKIFDNIYLGNGRIFFVVYYSSMNSGDNFYLYEFIPFTNKSKKIIKLKENIIDVKVLK